MYPSARVYARVCAQPSQPYLQSVCSPISLRASASVLIMTGELSPALHFSTTANNEEGFCMDNTALCRPHALHLKWLLLQALWVICREMVGRG